jgi:hypothetical protein
MYALIQNDLRNVLRPVVCRHHCNAYARLPVFPQTNLGPEQTFDARAARHPRQAHVQVQTSTGVVVRDCTWCVMTWKAIGCLANQYAVSMFVVGVIAIEVWHTEFPVWAFVLSLLIGD